MLLVSSIFKVEPRRSLRDADFNFSAAALRFRQSYFENAIGHFCLNTL